jgi:hypothetical protein
LALEFKGPFPLLPEVVGAEGLPLPGVEPGSEKRSCCGERLDLPDGVALANRTDLLASKSVVFLQLAMASPCIKVSGSY